MPILSRNSRGWRKAAWGSSLDVFPAVKGEDFRQARPKTRMYSATARRKGKVPPRVQARAGASTAQAGLAFAVRAWPGRCRFEEALHSAPRFTLHERGNRSLHVECVARRIRNADAGIGPRSGAMRCLVGAWTAGSRIGKPWPARSPHGRNAAELPRSQSTGGSGPRMSASS